MKERERINSEHTLISYTELVPQYLGLSGIKIRPSLPVTINTSMRLVRLDKTKIVGTASQPQR